MRTETVVEPHFFILIHMYFFFKANIKIIFYDSQVRMDKDYPRTLHKLFTFSRFSMQLQSSGSERYLP